MRFTMKLLSTILSVLMIGTLGLQRADAKLKIPIGNREVLHKVADLPDTEDYLIEKGESKPAIQTIKTDEKRYQDKYLDLARLHEEFNIA